MNKDIYRLPWLTDSYKYTHWRQIPPGTTEGYSYFESRGGITPSTIYWGGQYTLEQYFEGPVLRYEDIEELEDVLYYHFFKQRLFNYNGFKKLWMKHKGILPLEIKAVPEGMVIPTKNILMSVRSTDEEFPWLANFVEGLLVQSWYPSTVATLSMNMRKRFLSYLEKTGNPDLIDYKIHDFGFRGCGAPELAALGGAAHLLSSRGTDTAIALKLIKEFYSEHCAGNSIPAAEHFTITAWGKDKEQEAYENLLTQFPEGYLAAVSDSYDIFNACRNIWGGALRDRVLARNGVLVIRPDSGDPASVVVQVLEILGEKFGFEKNSKGYKVLNPKIRVIQGDGLDYEVLDQILSTMEAAGWSADNLAVGIGGKLLMYHNRDEHQFAFKCSSIIRNGKEVDVYKQPATMIAKNSKRGKLKLVEVTNPSLTSNGARFKTVRQSEPGTDILQTVFLNGKMMKRYSFEECRQNLARTRD